MKTLLAKRVVLLSLGLILMATLPKSDAFLQSPSPPANNPFASLLGSIGGGGRLGPFLVNSLPGPRPNPPPPSPTPPSTPPSTPPTTPPSTPPSTSSPPPPRTCASLSPASVACPGSGATCNFPACAAIPGCQQCQTNSGPGGGIICLRCCVGFALRPGGRICDSCTQVTNCATCDPINPTPANAPFVRCTACCHGFGLNFQTTPPLNPRCDPCSSINACLKCIDRNPALFDNPPPGAANDLTCICCAAGFRLDQGANTCTPS